MIPSALIWRPNWGSGVRERLEWRTAIQEAWDGSEHRARLRDLPRQTWEYALAASEDRRRALVASAVAIASAEEEQIDLPLWADITTLSAAADEDDTILYCDTTHRGFVAGAKVFLANGDATVTLVLSAVLDDERLQIAEGLESAWAAGTALYPVRTARLVSALEQVSLAPDVSQWRATLTTDDLRDPWEGAEGPDVYWGLPVWSRRPNWQTGVQWRTERPLALVDGETGPRAWYGDGTSPDLRVTHRYTAIGRDQCAALRAAIYARAGAAIGCWMPSYQRDVRLYSDAESLDSSLIVARAGWADIAGTPEHRHLQIVLWDDTRIYAEVTSAAAIDDSREELALEAPLSSGFTVADIRRISWMYWCRLDGDQVELVYSVPDVMQCELTWRRPRLHIGSEIPADPPAHAESSGCGWPELDALAAAAPSAPTGALAYVMPGEYAFGADGDDDPDSLSATAPAAPTGLFAALILGATYTAPSADIDALAATAPAAPTGTMS